MKKNVCLALLLFCLFGVFWVVGSIENGKPLYFSFYAIPFFIGAFSSIVFGKLYEGEE